MTAVSGGTPMATEKLGMGADRWCAAVECAQPDAVTGLVVLLGLGVVTLLVLAAFAHLGEAESVVDRERRRTRTERDAFAAFVRWVSDVDASETRMDGGTGAVAMAAQRGADPGLREVRRAYRETVMSMPHFEAEYGEPMPAHMSAEFDADVAAAVAEGRRLTPELRTALVRHGRVAAGQRQAFLDTLESEERSILDARDAFESVSEELWALDDRPLGERSFDGLAATWERLGDLEAECGAALERRQRTLDRARESGSVDAPSFAAYLYQPLSVTHPVLAEGVTLVERVRTARSRVVQTMTAKA